MGLRGCGHPMSMSKFCFGSRGHDKFERQLLKVWQSKNPELRLAFALATFQASGEFEQPALRDWEAKPKADQTFVNFRVFIQKEFGKQHKQNKTTAKSVGYGIANSITDKAGNLGVWLVQVNVKETHPTTLIVPNSPVIAVAVALSVLH